MNGKPLHILTLMSIATLAFVLGAIPAWASDDSGAQPAPPSASAPVPGDQAASSGDFKDSAPEHAIAPIATPAYLLDEGDVLSFAIVGEDDMKIDEVPVLAGGYITLPLVGAINIKGKSTDEAIQIAALALKKYYIDPKVILIVKKPRDNVFNIKVFGRVVKPGFYPVKRTEDANLITVIAYAGGFARRANQRNVVLIGKDGKMRAVDVRMYLEDGAASKEDIHVDDGDVVVVGEVGRPDFALINPVGLITTAIFYWISKS